jgi:hypothetical protein
MGIKRRASWQHDPVSSPQQPDLTPSRSLPPVSSMDRRFDGQHIGPCPKCGGHRWWDNRGQKRAGQAKASAPDFVCVECRSGARETDSPAPFARTTSLAAETPTAASPMGGVRGFRHCAAMKANGERCKGAAMEGFDVCGPHASTGSAPESRSTMCRGTTKAGLACRAAAQRGAEFCPAHQDQQSPNSEFRRLKDGSKIR